MERSFSILSCARFSFFCPLGITIPSQDILYSALGTLIKERKIYHTGEGYFIVTPQTYFITNNMARENNWWSFGSADDPPSPPPITYLLSNDACVESSQTLPVAHCKSCSCFSTLQTSSNAAPSSATAAPLPAIVPDQNYVSVSVSECTGKSLKWPRPQDHKPTVQHQSTSTAADYQASEVSKTTGTTNATSRKEKDTKTGRKFGLSLFRRNGGKKEKPKKEYVSFSGQFPPEEWPVRDEDDLNNLPRDLEHAIIKRINPELTVDNLTRHTVLMKKLEERREKVMDRPMDKCLDNDDKGVDKGMSTEILSFARQRHHHSSKGGRRPAQKASRTRRRAHSSREKHKEKEKLRSRTHVREVDYPEREDLTPVRLRVEIPIDKADHAGVDAAAEGTSLYKKRIENPFHAHALKNDETSTTPPVGRSHRKRDAKDGKSSGSARRERTSHRSKSWDPYQAKANAEDGEHAGKSPTSENRYNPGQGQDVGRDGLLQSELPPDYSSTYPLSSTLRMDDKVRPLRDGVKQESWEAGGDRTGCFQVAEYNSHGLSVEGGLSSVQKLSRTHPVTPSNHYEPATSHDLAGAWSKPPLRRRHSLRHSPPQRDSVLLPEQHFLHQQPGETKGAQDQQEIRPVHVGSREERLDLTTGRALSMTDAECFSEDDGRLYRRTDELDDEDTCSSLCVNDDKVDDLADVCRSDVADCNGPKSAFNNAETEFLSQGGSRRYFSTCCNDREPSGPMQNSRDCLPTATKSRAASVSSHRAGDAGWALGHHSQSGRSPGAQSGVATRVGPLVQERTGHEDYQNSDYPDISELAESSIFDYCQTSEVESDAETVRKSADEGESPQWPAEEVPGGDLDAACVPQVHAAALSGPSQARKEDGSGGTTEVGENQSITGDSGIDSPR